MERPIMLITILAFVAGVFLDYFWALCVDSVHKRRPIFAANLAVMFYMCTLFSTILIVDKQITPIIAYGVGNWVGTYLAVKRTKNEERKD
jgi:hypothetical protein